MSTKECHIWPGHLALVPQVFPNKAASGPTMTRRNLVRVCSTNESSSGTAGLCCWQCNKEQVAGQISATDECVSRPRGHSCLIIPLHGSQQQMLRGSGMCGRSTVGLQHQIAGLEMIVSGLGVCPRSFLRPCDPMTWSAGLERSTISLPVSYLQERKEAYRSKGGCRHFPSHFARPLVTSRYSRSRVPQVSTTVCSLRLLILVLSCWSALLH